MKIAVLSSHTPSLFWFRIDMMQALISAKCDVVAIGNELEKEWIEKFAMLGIKYRQINVQRNGTNPIQDIKTLKSIKSVLLQEQPDKIFCYQAKTVIYGCIAAMQLGISEVYPLIAGLGSVFLSSGIKADIIRNLIVAEYRYALKNSISVFFQNHNDSDAFVNSRILQQNKIVYINGSGVNVDKFVPTYLPVKPAFLNISRLIRDKGIREYLEACRFVKQQIPECRCLLVGPFDSNPTALTKDELDEYIEDGTIEYFGEQSDVRPYFQQASIFVLPSYHEGTPKTVLEAMACGRAVITTDAPGCRETVQDKVNGYLVPVKNVDQLAKRMLELANDYKRVVEMGVKGRQIVEEKFSVDKINQQILCTMQIERKENELC